MRLGFSNQIENSYLSKVNLRIMKIESAKRMKIVGQIHLRPCAALFCFISSILWSATLSKNALKSKVICADPWSLRGHFGGQ